MPGMSIHAVDIAAGRVAEGLAVRVERLDGPARILLAEGHIGANGLLDHPALDAIFPVGIYEVTFSIGEFLAGAPTPPFLGETPYRFGIYDPASHYHLPFKFTPWGFSCFRGGA